MMDECCSLSAMLARVLCGVFVCLYSLASAEQVRPHVLLVQLNAPVVEDTTVAEVFPSDVWQRQSGECLASPGRSAIQTALLFGTPPLEQGVVHDLDWRRKPVSGDTLADKLGRLGYQTHFYGAWALGSTAPYHPQGRGFQQAHYFEAGGRDTLADSWEARVAEPLRIGEMKKTTFIHLAEGRHLSRKSIFEALRGWLKHNEAPAVVVVLESIVAVKKKYYQPARWSVLSNQKLKKPLSIETDWDLYRAMCSITGIEVKEKFNITFFHHANWPVHESPEKNRHRGSLILGDGLALIDGLNLYRAQDFTPDLSNKLDISEHQKEHQALLTAHAQWWKTAGGNLHQPRAFDVGGEGGKALQLTALDWRTTKIIGSVNGRPTSPAMVYQKDLLAILAGLKNDPDYKNKFPAYSGSWSVNIKRAGRYKVTASLLPREGIKAGDKDLMKLEGGSAHIRLGENVATLRLEKGATAITLQTDADAGVTDLECWFTGQLALTRELGAFFVEIERIGDKKFDLKAKAKE